MALFEKFKVGLQKARTQITRYLSGAKLDYDALERGLIESDFGVAMSTQIVGAVRERCSRDARLSDVFHVAIGEVENLFAKQKHFALVKAASKPTVIFVVGVNGTGKTTSTAKLAHHLQEQGKKVALAACDTFRAAAIEQIKHWGHRLKCDVYAGAYNADPASVAHDAMTRAQEAGVDYLLVDTAGRQHTKHNLMAELAKIRRIIGKKDASAPHETLLVVDASIGGNALSQAREFNKITPLTGMIVTKLDGTGKGGIVVAIQKELGIPVKFIGLGEKMDDLQPFDAKAFTESLFSES